MEQLISPIRITGLLAILGALIYALGDVLLLAAKVDLNDYPKLKPFEKLLSGAEKFVMISPEKMMWGALIGVMATPLILLGYWQVYQGLSGANEALRLTAILLFGTASVIGAFVHGSFFYTGEYVKALNAVREDSQQVIADMISRNRKVMIITYAPVLTLILVASLLFSIMTGMGGTHLPVWMAAINPFTATIAWLVLKRILPNAVTDALEGAGFNIAFFVFFTCTTIALWNL